MAETRRKVDQDFKEGAVRLGRETGKPIAQVARELGRGPGPWGDSAATGRRVSKNPVAALMDGMGLAAGPKRGRKGTARPGKGRWKAPDLVKRDFPAEQINLKWYGDGTDIDTGEGRLYLDSVLDVGSRRVLGFALGEHHDAELAYGALVMAVAVRGGRVPGVIMHTDQGGEYTAGLFRAACARLSVAQSMGR